MAKRSTPSTAKSTRVSESPGRSDQKVAQVSLRGPSDPLVAAITKNADAASKASAANPTSIGAHMDARDASARAAEVHTRVGNMKEAETHRQASNEHAAKVIDLAKNTPAAAALREKMGSDGGGGDDRKRDDHGRFA